MCQIEEDALLLSQVNVSHHDDTIKVAINQKGTKERLLISKGETLLLWRFVTKKKMNLETN